MMIKYNLKEEIKIIKLYILIIKKKVKLNIRTKMKIKSMLRNKI